jgi:hypothetical protein
MKTKKIKKGFTKIYETPTQESRCLNAYVVAIIGASFVLCLTTFGLNAHFSVWFKGVKAVTTGQKGSIGLLGPTGFNASLNGTVVDSINSLTIEITERIDTFDFCSNGSCSSNSILLSNISTLINDSGLTIVNLGLLSSNLLFVEEITTNDTFCKLFNCTEAYEFALFYGTLVGNGTTNGTAALVAETNELTTILSNDTFVKYPFSDSEIVNGSLPLFELNGITPRNVIITDSNGLLTKESKLSVLRGGLNYNSSATTGFPFFTSGSLNYTTLLPYAVLDITGKIKDSDLTTTSFFDGSKFYLEGVNKVVITNGTGFYTISSQLSSALGGFGTSAVPFNGYAYFNNGAIEFYGNIIRTVFTAGSPNHVIVNDGSGFLSSQAQLSTSLGGTGQNLTGQTGYLKVTSGVVSATGSTLIQYSELNLTDSLTSTQLSVSANISRQKFALGSPNHVLINDGSGYFSSESALSVTRGGIGADPTTFSNGILSWNTTNYYTQPLTISSIQSPDLVDSSFYANISIDRYKIATGSANHVIINTALGILTSNSLLPLNMGGTSVDLTGQTGFLRKFNASISFMSVTASIAYSSLNLTNSLVNADFPSNLALTRTKIASGSASHVIINDGSGVLSSEATLATSRGGLNTNAGSSSGIPLFTSGVVSFKTYVTRTSFSPLLSFGGATTGIVQLITRGSYVRFDTLVRIEIFIILSNKGSATGNAAVSLPLAVQAGANAEQRGSTPILAGTIDIPAGYTQIAILPVNSASSAEFFFSGDNVARVQAQDTHFSSSSAMQLAFTYYTT